MKLQPREQREDPEAGALDSVLLAEAPGGRIACAAVFRVAAAQGVPVAAVGRAVQRLGLKITGCQLGCF